MRYEVCGELKDGTLQVIDPSTGKEITARIEKNQAGEITAIVIDGGCQ